MMSAVNLEKVRKAKSMGRRIAGTAYKRTRRDTAASGTTSKRSAVLPPVERAGGITVAMDAARAKP